MLLLRSKNPQKSLIKFSPSLEENMVSNFGTNTPVESSRIWEIYLGQTLVELLRKRQPEQFNRTAYTFLVDGETEEVSLT